jgi:methionyl-tRNA synthetase
MSTPIHVSVAWPYANGDLHVGHLAGALLPADIFARYHRLKGHRVLMVSGSDAHGTPITIEADKRGLAPRQLFLHYHRRFLETQQALGISYDLFTHTDTVAHHRLAQTFFLRLYQAGYLYREQRAQLYSERDRRFLPDRYVEGTCPHCGSHEARGDQCDDCGTLLDATDLRDPRSILDGSRPVVRQTEHWFLNLPAFTERLLHYLDQHASHWRPHVLNFSRTLIDRGLQGRPITRDLDWGVPVPLPGWETKCLYVWFEALIGYLSASIEWAHRHGHPEAWRTWWYHPEARIYNFLGKDNIPFHTVIWPAQLLGVGRLDDADAPACFTLPYDVPANAFMTIEHSKFSKSRQRAVWLPDLLTRYDPDVIRYYVASVLPETDDTDFSWDALVHRTNDELIAAWGNLVHRVLSFAVRHWEGHVPTPGVVQSVDQALLTQVETGFTTIGALLEAVKLRAALREAMGLVRAVNGYLTQAPWFSVIKEDKTTAATTVYSALRAIDALKVLLAPFVPFSAERLHRALGYKGPLFGHQRIETTSEGESTYDILVYDGTAATGQWAPSGLQPGQRLAWSTPLYTKLDEAGVDVERARLD